MTPVLVTIETADGRQQFTDPLAAVRCLLRALDARQLGKLKRDEIGEVQRELKGIQITRQAKPQESEA